MIIRVDDLPKELKNEVIRIGGVPTYYEDLDDSFQATFYHHELKAYSDHVIITDELTGYKFTVGRGDFYTVELF